jgi:hypothetical protein
MADFFDAIADEFNSRFKRKNTAHDNEFVGFNGRGKVISRHALTPDRGIIASQGRTTHSRDMLQIDDHFVPLPIHCQWCEWASQQFSDKH